MNHPTLGRLEAKGTDNESFEGKIMINGNIIGLNIDLETAPQDQVFMLATDIVASITILNEKAKNVICQDLLEKYNSGWNEYDEIQEDGSTKTVVNPQLDSGQFIREFELDSITVCGTDCIELWYKPNNLFWGHSVFVTSFDGLEFEDANAQLFG